MLSQALIKISGANKGTVPGIHAPGGGRLQTPPHLHPTAEVWPFPQSREDICGEQGHISQARAQRLFWFEFPLCSLAWNIKWGGKRRERKTCPGRLCPQHLLPSHQQHTHCHLLKLIPTQTHAHTHTSASGHKKRLVNQTQIRTREVI